LTFNQLGSVCRFFSHVAICLMFTDISYKKPFSMLEFLVCVFHSVLCSYRYYRCSACCLST